MGRPLGGRTLIQARAAAVAEIDPSQGHALAGLIDAEGSFGIVSNNAGQSWACNFQMVQRDDDWQVLDEFRALTGLGHLSAVKPQANSRPQTAWRITSQLECQRLCDLLARFPLRGRKRRELAVWTRAVRHWAGSSGDNRRWRTLAGASAELRALRRYVPPHPDDLRVSFSDCPELRWYFGGFFTGEGSFHLDQKGARIVVKLRRDDRPLLEAFRQAAARGLSVVYGPGQPVRCVGAWI